ncbi:MAG TPA: Xaa-Pro peptidase family protein [Candidatus Angelobacter sp.]|nr:Xaa-Pro peptidase family protein [Candidatus Angelobacter sp.]
MADFYSLMDYAARQRVVAGGLASSRLDAVLITHLPNIRYLCGFSGTAGLLVVPSSGKSAKPTFYTDGRYAQQATDEVQGVKVVITKKAALIEACAAISRSRIKVLGFEAAHLTYSVHQQINQALRGKVRLKAVDGQVELLRLNKGPGEIEQIRASALVAASLFPAALAAIHPGVAENLVAGEMELQARRAGAEKMSFDTIVAAGERSALPHGRASSQPVPGNGFIILDWGVILAGYCSDMTRTVHVGPVSASHRRMYEAVLAAQLASIEAVGPGVSAGEVDRAGRELLKKAGYGAYFTHSTGHGVGLEVHEAPRLAKGQTQKLTPGMVVTIEPGIYIPDEGGVRIEDMVLVTESGREVLTPATKDLITL